MDCPINFDRRSSFRTDALLAALLLAIICVISWPGMTAPLLLDDNDQISHVANFKSWKDCLGPDCFGLFRPLKNFIFYYMEGISLFKWHAFTLAAYLGGVLGLYALFRRMLGSPIWAFAGALLWASCPTQVSTMAWMSAVNLSLAMLLSCACMIFHDLSQSKAGRNATLTALACLMLFLAQVSYETAVAVPALCVLADLLKKRAIFSKATILRYCALGLVTVVYLAIRSHFGAVYSAQSRNLGFAPETQAWQLSVSAPWFLWKHFSMWLMPVGRIEFCSAYIWGKSASTTELVIAWVWLFSLIGAALLTWKRLPMVAIGILWFLAASFPPSNFIPIWSGPIEDYYLFFPGVGLVLILLGCAKALTDWMRTNASNLNPYPKMIGGGLLVIGGMWRLLCLPLFWLQADLWNRPAELYLRLELSRPLQVQLQACAAWELIVLGQLEEAGKLARKSHEAAPWHPFGGMLMGYIALREGDFTTAEKLLRESLEKHSQNARVRDFSRLYLAETLHKQGAETKLVRETLIPLLENRHGGAYHMDAIRMLIDCYVSRNQPNDALRAARNAVKLHPEDAQLNQLLAKLKEAYPGTSETK